MYRIYRKTFIPIFLILATILAANDAYHFTNPEDERRFFEIINEIRCPKCTGGSLASSDAPVSKTLKQKIYEMVIDGKSNMEIKFYVKERFGEQSDYFPSFSNNKLLWLMPLIFFSLFVLIFVLRRRI